MVKEAEKHATEDQKRRESVEAINQAEQIVNDTEAKMNEYKDQLDNEEVRESRVLLEVIKIIAVERLWKKLMFQAVCLYFRKDIQANAEDLAVHHNCVRQFFCFPVREDQNKDCRGAREVVE